MVIPVVGPSKAGKSQATGRLLALALVHGLERYDLDGALGQDHRSDSERAITLVEALVARRAPQVHVLVDVGAGQFFADGFRAYLAAFPRYPGSVIVVWCDEQSFRFRHGANAPNEVDKYYGASSPLRAFHEAAVAASRAVDTSGPYAPLEWANKLAGVVGAVITEEGAA